LESRVASVRGKKLSELGEKKVIEEVIARYVAKPSWDEYLEVPDDARDVLPGGPRILFSIDGYSLEKILLPWRTLRDAGWCAVVGAISDHIAKGGVPRDLLVSLGMPSTTSVENLIEIFEGIRDATTEYRLRLLGGDLNESRSPWIDVAVLSYTSAKKPPRRCCGKVGDEVIATGVYGAMGYVVIHGIEESARVNWVIEATKKPRVYVETAIAISLYYRAIHASMDVSDGLGYTLIEMSRAMSRGIELVEEPEYYRELDGVCKDLECLWKYILNGGEEYGVVLVVDQRYTSALLDYLHKLGIPAKLIGRVVDKEPHIYLREKNIERYVKFWDQFRGWSATTKVMEG